MIFAICSIIRDPYPPYLMEWLNHHYKLGVDLFFIYDNESSPSISEIIEGVSFRDKIGVFKTIGRIVPGDIRGIRIVQNQVYDKCIGEIKSGLLPLCNWLAIIDEDEFLICENGDIKKTLEEYNEYSGLVVNWRVYGSSGLKNRTPTPQMEKFVHPTSPSNFVNYHVKSIVNPLKVNRTRRNPHTFRYLEGNEVNVDHKPLKGLFQVPIYKKIWINHYYTRSQEEWEEKAGANINSTAKEEESKLFRNPNQFIEIDEDCNKYAKSKGHTND